jgi:rhamnulokinase
LEVAKAVAVDLGAGSGRIAVGELLEGKIDFKIFRQIAHEPRMCDGLLRWDSRGLVEFCKEAVNVALAEKASSLGIDSWGVDHGFLDRDGGLIAYPVCYRDLSHLAAFELLAPHRRHLYELTGIQHQPFNTICQLVARRLARSEFPGDVADWMILPDLLGYLIGGERCSELTQASTTQLLGMDGAWSAEAFEIAGWPVPQRPLSPPGAKAGRLADALELIAVGSHDTASAVAGFGRLRATDLFLNIGTWSLCGAVIETGLNSRQAEGYGFTNERTVDGKIRFLKNIPGFYFINRLHSDLGVKCSVPEWIASATFAEETIDLFDPEFFNPDSMLETCKARLSKTPKDESVWAAVAVDSLARAVRTTADQLTELTATSMSGIRVGGGGSQSPVLCQRLADRLGLPVTAGPAEATVLGNLVAQFLGQGKIQSWDEAFEIVDQSTTRTSFEPG